MPSIPMPSEAGIVAATEARPVAASGRTMPMWLALTLLSGFLVLTLGVAVSAGGVSIPLDEVWQIAANRIRPGSFEPTWSAGRESIVWDLRFPRALLGVLVGAGLAATGAVLQAATRTPLADPFLFGMSAGAALGAVAVIIHLGDFAGASTLPTAAFLGALLALAIVLGIVRSVPAGSDHAIPERLLLAGLAASFILMAATNFLIFFGDQRAAHSVVFWMMGGLGLARWDQLLLPAVVVAGALIWFQIQASRLNALLLGDETAVALGVRVGRLRLMLFVAAALVTAVLVALSGAIGFVGLIVPHILRRVVGGDNRLVIPLSAVVGALFLVWTDVLARTLLAPQELPIGILTAAVGGTYFAWSLTRR